MPGAAAEAEGAGEEPEEEEEEAGAFEFQGDWYEFETYESFTPDVLLSVRPSTIPGAGDGLFLASFRAEEGTKLLCEEGRLIKRPQAKKLLNDPACEARNRWRSSRPDGASPSPPRFGAPSREER